MNPRVQNQTHTNYPIIVSQCPCATTLQLPPAQPLIEGTGTLASANLQATALATQSLQGKDLSVQASIFNRESGKMEKRHFGVSYEQDTEGTKTPTLYEMVNGKQVDMKAKLHFYADGKLYGANGELKGEFAFDSGTHIDFLKASVIQAGGEFRDKAGTLTRFNNAEMKLGGEAIVIVNAPPPNLVKSVRDVEAPTLENQKGNAHGLFGNTEKKAHCEVVWVSPDEAKRNREVRPASHEMSVAIKDSSTKQLSEGRWKLKDGTVVGRDSDGYFISKVKVLPTTMHDFGSTAFNLGRTGVEERVYLEARQEIAPSPKKAAMDLPELAPPPRAPRPEIPAPEPIAPKPMLPPTPEPVAPKKEPLAPAPTPTPKEEPQVQSKSAPKTEIVFERALVENQLRVLQRSRAITHVLLQAIVDPNYSAPTSTGVDAEAVRKAPAAVRDTLKKLVDDPLDESEHALVAAHRIELEAVKRDSSSKGIERAQSSMIRALEALEKPAARVSALQRLSVELDEAMKDIVGEHKLGIDPKKAIPIGPTARTQLLSLKVAPAEFTAEMEPLLATPKLKFVAPSAHVDHQLRLLQLGYAQVDALAKTVEFLPYVPDPITGVDPNKIRTDPQNAIGMALSELIKQPLQNAESAMQRACSDQISLAGASPTSEHTAFAIKKIEEAMAALSKPQTVDSRRAELKSLADALRETGGRLADAAGRPKFSIVGEIPIDNSALDRLKQDKALPEWLTLKQVETRNKIITELLQSSK